MNFDIKVNKPLLIIIISILEAIPFLFIKNFILSDGKNYTWLILAIVVQIILAFAYILLLLVLDIGIAYALISIISLLLIVAAGVAFYQEKLSDQQIVGMILALVTLYLLVS